MEKQFHGKMLWSKHWSIQFCALIIPMIPHIDYFFHFFIDRKIAYKLVTDLIWLMVKCQSNLFSVKFLCQLFSAKNRSSLTGYDFLL